MNAPEQTDYIVQCLRTAGSMHEKDARSFLAEHDAGVRTETLAEVTAWLIKKAREFHVSSRKREREQGDLCAVLASKIARGAVRPDNLRMLPTAGFFEADRTYRHSAWVFRCDAVIANPNNGERTAIGWSWFEVGHGQVVSYTDAHWADGWTDVTEAGGS